MDNDSTGDQSVIADTTYYFPQGDGAGEEIVVFGASDETAEAVTLAETTFQVGVPKEY